MLKARCSRSRFRRTTIIALKQVQLSVLVLLICLQHVVPQGRRTRNRKVTCATIEGGIAYQGVPEPINRMLPESTFVAFNMSNCNATDYSQDSRQYRGLQAKKPYLAEVCSNANTISGINGRWLKERDSYTCRIISNEKLLIGNSNPRMNEDLKMTPQGYDHQNLFMYEFRFRRKSFEGDDIVISCPLPRGSCTYADSGVLMEPCGMTDSTYLKGYILRINLQHRYRDRAKYPDDDEFGSDYPNRWWSVESCEAKSIEVEEPPTYFEEHIEYYYKPKIYYYPIWWIVSAVLGTSFLLFCCGTYYFADECLICHKKNAIMSLCTKKNHPAYGLCIICRVLGAEKPHPEIVAR